MVLATWADMLANIQKLCVLSTGVCAMLWGASAWGACGGAATHDSSIMDVEHAVSVCEYGIFLSLRSYQPESAEIYK